MGNLERNWQVGNSAHSSSCVFSFTSGKDWQRRNEQIWNLLPNAQWTFLDHRLTFFNSKNRLLKLVQRTSRQCKDFFVRCCQLLRYCQWKNKVVLGSFKVLSQDEGRADFCQIHRDRHCLEVVFWNSLLICTVHCTSFCFLTGFTLLMIPKNSPWSIHAC
jgi:hypothetical protein